ncbi:MAG TPA: methylmalonyl Co-A mutase-associated GTPase MeaB [Chthoniobacteraceae bacterium]|nr:methylmalonyl Co-A mutase-associated GTPase MeaB [Chthoniobacteraceae bacterium]
MTMPEREPSRASNAGDYVSGVLRRDRSMLARAITLIESNAPRHAVLAEQVVQQLLPHAGNSIRVGITGVPGVGKSTFIESLGCMLCNRGKRVAVLAVDPSSSLTHGSILGDKTRMEMLSREADCFIRPSPSGGTPGGVARKSRETILICEAAGYDVVLVETMGVGQGETTVRSMVDFFLVLMLAGAGDELQGIKKGIIELADALLITKADGDNKLRAESARIEFSRVLHYLQSPTPGWQPPVMKCSSKDNQGIADAWEIVERFHDATMKSGHFEANRRKQTLDWIHDMLGQELFQAFLRNPAVISNRKEMERQVLAGKISPTAAVKRLLTIHNHDPEN